MNVVIKYWCVSLSAGLEHDMSCDGGNIEDLCKVAIIYFFSHLFYIWWTSSYRSIRLQLFADRVDFYILILFQVCHSAVAAVRL